MNQNDIELHFLIEKAQRMSPNGKKLPIGRGFLTIKGEPFKKYVIWPGVNSNYFQFSEDRGVDGGGSKFSFFLNNDIAKNGSTYLTVTRGTDTELRRQLISSGADKKEANDKSKVAGFKDEQLGIGVPMRGFEEDVTYTDQFDIEHRIYKLRFYDKYSKINEYDFVLSAESELDDKPVTFFQTIAAEKFPEYESVRKFFSKASV